MTAVFTVSRGNCKSSRKDSVQRTTLSRAYIKIHYDHQVITGFRTQESEPVLMRLPVGILPFWARYYYSPNAFTTPFDTTYGDQWDNADIPDDWWGDDVIVDPDDPDIGLLTSRGGTEEPFEPGEGGNTDEPFVPGPGEEPFLPDPWDDEEFEEDGEIRRYTVTGWSATTSGGDQEVVLQRIGNDQSAHTATTLVDVSMGEFPNLTASAIRHYPSFNTQDGEAHLGAATLHDFVYLVVSVPNGNISGTGDFVGLFTGDVTLSVSYFDGWADMP